MEGKTGTALLESCQLALGLHHSGMVEISGGGVAELLEMVVVERVEILQADDGRQHIVAVVAIELIDYLIALIVKTLQLGLQFLLALGSGLASLQFAIHAVLLGHTVIHINPECGNTLVEGRALVLVLGIVECERSAIVDEEHQVAVVLGEDCHSDDGILGRLAGDGELATCAYAVGINRLATAILADHCLDGTLGHYA